MVHFQTIRLLFLVHILLFITALLLSIAIGSTDISLATTLHVLLAKILPLSTPPLVQDIVIWSIRVPRVLVAAAVGAGLAVAGVQMQGLFHNPLAAPEIIGTSAGGVLGAVSALALGLTHYSIFYLPIFAFIGAFTALLLIYALAYRHLQHLTTLLLAGVALNALLGAVTSYVISVSWTDYEVAREILFWLMGGLENRLWSHVEIVLPIVFIGISIALFYSRELDILLLGNDTAQTLGIEVKRVKLHLLANIALLTGAAVAVSGMIGFIGLIIPHISRLLVGPSHRFLIPISALSGATFLLCVDLLARTLHRPQEIRLGILTAFIGAPFFLYLLLKQRYD
jgi:iron complex transport system permease protein